MGLIPQTVRTSPKFTCDDLNALGLKAKVVGIVHRGEDIEFVFDSDNDKDVDDSMNAIIAAGYIPGHKIKEKKTTEIPKNLKGEQQ